MKVLVADDDPVYRDLLESLLRQWQFEPIVVSDGLGAWEIMQGRDAPPVVLLDWMMPNMEGFEVARRIRSHDQSGSKYIILITGSKKEDELLQVLICGADDYLIKPFHPMDLKVHLRCALRVLRLETELTEARLELDRLRSGSRELATV